MRTQLCSFCHFLNFYYLYMPGRQDLVYLTSVYVGCSGGNEAGAFDVMACVCVCVWMYKKSVT